MEAAASGARSRACCGGFGGAAAWVVGASPREVCTSPRRSARPLGGQHVPAGGLCVPLGGRHVPAGGRCVPREVGTSPWWSARIPPTRPRRPFMPWRRRAAYGDPEARRARASRCPRLHSAPAPRARDAASWGQKGVCSVEAEHSEALERETVQEVRTVEIRSSGGKLQNGGAAGARPPRPAGGALGSRRGRSCVS